MCTGKTLNFPDVLPAVKAKKQYPDLESQYSIKNIKENYLKDKVMSGFTTVDDSQEGADKSQFKMTTETNAGTEAKERQSAGTENKRR